MAAASSQDAKAELKPDLLNMKCLPCVKDGGEGELLDSASIVVLVKELCPSWQLQDYKGRSQGKLVRSFVAKNFKFGMACLQEYGSIADDLGHHPDLHLTDYRTVTVELTTHARDGLTINDFIVAAKLDRVAVTYSPKWLRENADTTAGLASSTS